MVISHHWFSETMQDRKPTTETLFRWFLPILALYAALYGAFLVSADFAPYVFDNNETYSSIIHARNLAEFDIGTTFGLTDEAYGSSPQAHPYVYTHQGNFPRLFALLLYALGLDSAEAQIAATTFTVGVLGIWLAFVFFGRLVSPLFAVLYCLLLMTDYVMQAQWQVNTWRVWHLLLFFSSLLCTERALSRPRLLWIGLTVINFAALFYFEFVFAAFVALLVGAYTVALYPKDIRRIILTWVVTGSGAVLGISILVFQLVLYLGWDGFLQDLRLTFFARNFSPSDPAAAQAFRNEVWQFVKENRTVFWDNFISQDSGFRRPGTIVQVFSRFNLLPYTPLLTYVALALSAGLTAAAMSRRSVLERLWLGFLADQRIPGLVARPLIAAAFVFCAATIAHSMAFAGFLKESSSGWSTAGDAERVVYVAAVALLVLGLFGVRRRRPAAPPVAPARLLATLAILAGLSTLAHLHYAVYAVNDVTPLTGTMFEPFWRDVLDSTGAGDAGARLVALLAVWLCVKLALADRGFRGGATLARITALMAFSTLR